jgi:succinyl-diaminopimelate desuccinylase
MVVNLQKTLFLSGLTPRIPMQPRLEATLEKLVAIPSVTSDTIACHEILDFVRSELEPFGLFIERHTDTPNPWLIATTQNTKTPVILLAAHLDVVPAPPESFIIQKQEARLYGRGVYDMKFAAACYLELIKTHSDKLHDLNIGILFTTDEEQGGLCMPGILESGLQPSVVFIPDGGDNWCVEKRAKGLYGVELTAHGTTAHGSRPWEGESALIPLLDVIQALRAQYPSKDRSGATLSIGVLRAGEAINQVPGQASVAIDFRSFSREDLEEYKLLIAGFVSQYNLDFRLANAGEPISFDPAHSNVQSFLQTLRDQIGKDEVSYCESYGSSDARFFAPFNIPCILIEPNGGNRHTDNEWLEAADLSKYYQLIERWILSK